MWNAWWELHGSRSFVVTMAGATPQALRPSEILAWLELEGIANAEERFEFVEALRAMDRTYLEWWGGPGDAT